MKSKANKKIPAFLTFIDQKEVIFKLSDEEAGQLYKAMCEYADTATITGLDKAVDLVFTSFKLAFDRNKAHYIKKCETLRKNASKGGKARVKQMVANATKSKQIEPISNSKNKNKSKTKTKKNISDETDEAFEKVRLECENIE